MLQYERFLQVTVMKIALKAATKSEDPALSCTVSLLSLSLTHLLIVVRNADDMTK